MGLACCDCMEFGWQELFANESAPAKKITTCLPRVLGCDEQQKDILAEALKISNAFFGLRTDPFYAVFSQRSSGDSL